MREAVGVQSARKSYPFCASQEVHRSMGGSLACPAAQAWGLMGWRCGYVAYPNLDGSDYLGLQLVKVQVSITFDSVAYVVCIFRGYWLII